jgi:hypothetical protein
MRWIIITLLFFTASPAWAGEIFGLYGKSFDSSGNDNSYAWQLEYREGLSEHFEASFTHLNEGHLPGHHRDGQGVQLWARNHLFDRRLSLAVGAGPYLYYDTTPGIANTEMDRHGLAVLSSVAATWHFDNRLLLQLRVNGVATTNSIDTVSALLGLGYQLDPPPSGGPEPELLYQPRTTAKNEITLFLGATDVFNNGSSHSVAAAIEYRRALLRYLEWSAALLYEGESDLIRRRGVATQLWAVKSFLNDDLSLGVGAGPYLAFDSLAKGGQGGNELFVLPIITMTAGYRLNPQWGARFSWNRIITSYDRDSDVWLGGVSYLF